MKITVTTVYENIPESQASWWTERVFNSAAVVRDLGPGKAMQLKRDFAGGKEVSASSGDPRGTGRATTTWKLEK